ncbi:hypothetical protein EZV62_006714 [Acer yangbiense]|uniref:CCHC-type domain-containing protein n=1 Tax=Acer yangbiense TaxID=1000413 RepID=A0A5C7I9L6_9ROSI|nr:hypothetical protein EZV62_006714 [Acer yangbiense]
MGGPWYFDRTIIIFEEPTETRDIRNMSFAREEFWIQIHNVPLICMSEEIGFFLGKMIGEVREVDLETGKGEVRFLWVRTVIVAEEPLKWSLRVDILGSGEITTMLLRYERLQDYCFKCGRLGQVLRECLKEGEERDVKSEDCLRLSVWLCALSPPKKARYGGGRPFDRNRGRQNGYSGNNFFSQSTGQSSGDWRGTNTGSPKLLSNGGQKVSYQEPREKGLVGHKIFEEVCIKTDKERQESPGINICGSEMMGSFEAVQVEKEKQRENEDGNGPELDRLAGLNQNSSFIQCKVAQGQNGVPDSVERQVGMDCSSSQSPSGLANLSSEVGPANRGSYAVKNDKMVKYGPGVWKRVKHKKTQKGDIIDLGEKLGKRPNCGSSSEGSRDNGQAKVAKFEALGNANARLQAVGDDYNIVDNNFHGESGLQAISNPNNLKPGCVTGGESDEREKEGDIIRVDWRERMLLTEIKDQGNAIGVPNQKNYQDFVEGKTKTMGFMYKIKGYKPVYGMETFSRCLEDQPLVIGVKVSPDFWLVEDWNIYEETDHKQVNWHAVVLVGEGTETKEWIFDGTSAAIFAKENLLANVLSATPQVASRVMSGFKPCLGRFLQVGPLCCWPGGLCLSRSIGDTDVGEFIVPVPHVKQVKLSNAGGRLMIASDGIWDALSSDMAAQSCRGLPAELAAKLVVKEALRSRRLKDDTTGLVVDIIPSDHPARPITPRKKHNMLSSLLFGKKALNSTNKASNKLSAVGVVEELFEEGSAMLAERLGKEFPLSTSSGLFKCAVCQVDQPAGDGLSVNSRPFFSPASKPWEGPFLCTNCRRKKDAMEGKRPS